MFGTSPQKSIISWYRNVNRSGTTRQGFPIRIHDTRAGEYKGESLLRVSIKGAHLPRDITNASPIHQTQDRPLELSQQVGNRASAPLTGIFASRAITAIMQLLFDGPMISDSRKHPLW